MQDAQDNGRTIHLREHARYLLDVAEQPNEALKVAKENWQKQKELADLRLLQASAKASNDTATLRALQQEYAGLYDISRSNNQHSETPQ